MTVNLLLSVRMLKDKSGLVQLGSYFLALATIPVSYCTYTWLNKVITEIWEHGDI